MLPAPPPQEKYMDIREAYNQKLRTPEEAVKVVRKPGWAEVKRYIKETGEIPDGVEPYETEPVFTVKEAE